MELYDELKQVTCGRLCAIANQYYEEDISSPDSQTLIVYLARNFPELANFARATAEELYQANPEDLEDAQMTHFLLGAISAFAFLGKHAELRLIDE